MSSDFLVTFNGIDITSTLRVNHLDRGVRLGRSSNYRVRRNRLGVDRGGYTSQLITFPMEFTICNDIKAKREQLIEILNVTEPKPLTFSDEPGKVYYAIPRSDVPIQEIFTVSQPTPLIMRTSTGFFKTILWSTTQEQNLWIWNLKRGSHLTMVFLGLIHLTAPFERCLEI